MPAGRKRNGPKRNKVLLIAINKYQHQKHLNNAVGDVEAFRKVLIEKYDYQEADFIDCIGERATRQGIFKALRDLVLQSEQLDNAIIYFSGHGQFDPALEAGSWVTFDSDDPSDDITSDTVNRTFVRNIKAKHILLIVDACFSGSLFSVNKAVSPQQILKNFKKMEALPSRYAITSGRSDQEVGDGRKGGHSPFATSLLNYFDKNGPNIFSVLDLIQHVLSTAPHNYRQQPLAGPLYEVGHENGQMIFRRKGAIETTESPKRAEELDAFCFSLCKTKANYKTYLRLFPKGKFREQAMQASKPKDQITHKELEMAQPEIGPAEAFDKVLNKLLEKKESPLLDEAILLHAEWNNTVSQMQQGIIKEDRAHQKNKVLQKQLTKLNKELGMRDFKL